MLSQLSTLCHIKPEPVLVDRGALHAEHTIKVDDKNDGDDDKTMPERGSFRTFVWGLATIGVGLCALIVAAAMCAVCIIGSCILWLRGLSSILEWRTWKWSKMGRTVSGKTKRHGCPTAMPGQEHGDSWEHAWEHVAKVRNFRVRHERDSEHFHVAPLLHSTTGLTMERLCLLTKRKHDSRQQQNVEQSEKGKGEMAGNLSELDPGSTGGYLFPVQVPMHSSFMGHAP